METEQLEQLLRNIERIQSIMIDVATGKSRIQNEEDDYIQVYEEVQLEIELLQEEGLVISNSNTFTSLWDWHQYWSSNLDKYVLREKFIYELFLNSIETIEEHLDVLSGQKLSNSSIENLDKSQLEKVLEKIEQLQSIMIDVTTGQSRIEDEEEIYIKLYQNITSQIKKLRTLGLPINNPNYFRSLNYCKAYCLSELETYQLRRDFISNLYINIVSPIKKTLQKNRLKANSSEELLQDLKRYLIQAQSTKAPTAASQSSVKAIQVSNEPNIEVVSSKAEIQDVAPVSNEKSTQAFVPIFTMNPQSSQPLSSNTVTDVVIITALQKERDAVLRYLDSPQQVQTSVQEFYRALVKTQKSDTTYQVVILCLPAMGNLQSAVATQRAIAEFNPSHIILVGIAGGVPKDNSRYLGDIIVGEQIVYYELGKQIELEQGGSKIQRRYEPYRPARVLLDTAKNLLPQNWALSIKTSRPDGTNGRVIPQVHFGVIASGDKVITDPSLINELQSDWSKLVGVEMEGAGTALAAYESDFSPGVLLVKGMCDWADGSKNDDWQEYAAETAASFVIQMLKSAPFESKLKLDTPNTQESPVESKLILEPSNKEQSSQTVKKTNKRYYGQVKILICQRLVRDWENLADYFDIELHERETFEQGKKAQRVWEWLQQRNRLDELEDALIAIGREDLAQELNK